MQRLRIFPLLFLILSLLACTQPVTSHSSSTDSTSPHAAIVLRDGTTVTGIVTSSTPSQITLNRDTGGTQTVLTKDVKSVDYGDATTATSPAATPAVAQSPAPAPNTAVIRGARIVTMKGKEIIPINQPLKPARS